MTAGEPVDRPWDEPADESADESAVERPGAGPVVVVLLASLGLVPVLAGALGAVGFLVQQHTTTEFWTTVVYLACGLTLAAGGKAAEVGYLFLREVVAHRSPWATVPGAVVAGGLALTSGVESFLAIYSGVTPWVWLVAAGPVAAGVVAAVAIAAAPAPAPAPE